MSKNILVGEQDDLPVADKTELELKINKITTLMDVVTQRIETHERQLEKLYHVAERQEARDKIARLTQKILESQ